MSKRKSRFTKVWGSATDIGRQFGMSAIAVNRRLEERGLRDPARKCPTEVALAEGWALATPLANGIPHFMWSRHLVGDLLKQTASTLSPSEIKTEALLRDICRLERDQPESAHKCFPVLMEDFAGFVFRRLDIEAVCERLKLQSQAERFCQLLGVQEYPALACSE